MKQLIALALVTLTAVVGGLVHTGEAKAGYRCCVYVHSYYKPSTGSYVSSHYRSYPSRSYGYGR